MGKWDYIVPDHFDRKKEFLEKQAAFSKLPKEIQQRYILDAILDLMVEDIRKVKKGLSNIMWVGAIEPRDATRDLYDHLIDFCAYLCVISED